MTHSKYPMSSEWASIPGFKFLSIRNLQITGQCRAVLNYAGKQGQTIGEVLIERKRDLVIIVEVFPKLYVIVTMNGKGGYFLWSKGFWGQGLQQRTFLLFIKIPAAISSILLGFVIE